MGGLQLFSGYFAMCILSVRTPVRSFSRKVSVFRMNYDLSIIEIIVCYRISVSTLYASCSSSIYPNLIHALSAQLLVAEEMVSQRCDSDRDTVLWIANLAFK